MTQKLTDEITDLYIDNYDVGSFDDDRNMYQQDGTTLNVKYNMGDKYLLGGRCDKQRTLSIRPRSGSTPPRSVPKR